MANIKQLSNSQLEAMLEKLKQDYLTTKKGSDTSLFHDLQVHQIELEIQHRTLLLAQTRLKEQNQRYLNLYNYAPVGYATFNNHGVITDINFTGANLLGESRSDIIGRPFNHWLEKDCQPAFFAYILKIRQSLPTEKYIELRIKPKDLAPIYVSLECIPILEEMYIESSPSQALCRTAIIDITKRKHAENELIQSQAYYRNLFENSPLPQWEGSFLQLHDYFSNRRSQGVTDFQTYFQNNPQEIVTCGRLFHIQDINRAALQLFEIANKKTFIKLIGTIFTEQALGIFCNKLAQLAEGQTYFATEMTLRSHKGKQLQVVFSFNVVRGYENNLGRIAVAITDETEYRLAKAALQKAHDELELRIEQRTAELAQTNLLLKLEIEERYKYEEKLKQAARVFQSTSEGIVITDTNARIIAVNGAFSKITGFSEQDVLGKTPLMFRANPADDELNRNINLALQRIGHWQSEVWNRHKNGDVYPAWENISVITDDAGMIVNHVNIFSDIRSVKETEERLKYIAHHDPLTGLPNRLLFQARLEQSLDGARRRKKQIALLFLDLDRFKYINDTLGHSYGDQLLIVIANRLKECVRAEDTVARLGGDEFTVVLNDIHHAEDAALLAQKLLESIIIPIVIDNKEVITSSSIGISIFPDDAQTAEDLIKTADASMYRAKDRGRHTYEFYTRELTQLAYEHLAIEHGIRDAIAKQQFSLLYQPQFNLKSGRLVGVEALLRWKHPQEGLILPERFLHVAEECSLIRDLDRWSLHASCAQAAAWQKTGCSAIRIAVNVSAKNIICEGFAEHIKQILIEHGASAEWIELEMTEVILRSSNTASIRELHKLKEMGISLAIDNFGSGYSSLASLKELPIDRIKIDKSFIKDLPHSKNDAGITTAVIAIGNNLGLTVVAEGVETDAQWAFLRDAGCHEVQGYRFSVPKTAAVIEPLVRRSAIDSIAI